MDAPRRLVTFTNIPDGNIKLEHFRLCHAALFGEAASGCGAVVLRCQTKEKGVDLRLHERRTDAHRSRGYGWRAIKSGYVGRCQHSGACGGPCLFSTNYHLELNSTYGLFLSLFARTAPRFLSRIAVAWMYRSGPDVQ